jgi:hypothetical protein
LITRTGYMILFPLPRTIMAEFEKNEVIPRGFKALIFQAYYFPGEFQF